MKSSQISSLNACLYVTSVRNISSLCPNIIFKIKLSLYHYFLRRQKVKQKKNKTREQTKNRKRVYTGRKWYDSVTSRAEDNYQELATVTADQQTITITI